MSEQPKKPEVFQEKKSRVGLIFAILAVIIIVQGVKIFMDHEDKLELKEDIAVEESEHAATMQRLNEIQADLELKIVELEKLGGDITELQAAKEEIEKELQNTKKRDKATISRIQNKVSGYEELLVAKDKEIERLAALNEQLYTENKDLKVEANQLNRTINELSEEQLNLQGKIDVASKLAIQNVKVIAVSSRGRESESPFKARQVMQLKVTFNISKNDVAPIEGKQLMMRVMDPQGNVLFDVAKGSGTFFYLGKEEFYTATQEILFDNSQQEVIFFYEKGSNYETGKYEIEVYTEDYKMGTGSFEIK